MGLFKGMGDAIENAQALQQQAQSQMAAGGAMGVSPTEMATMQKLQRLNAVGVETPATIAAMAPTGNVDIGGGKEYSFTVDIEAATPYQATFTQFMHEPTMGSWTSQGAAVNVKVDPDDPNSMILWGGR